MTITVKRHTFQSAATATGNGTALTVQGYSAVGLQVTGITTATITVEGTIDGSNWAAIRAKSRSATTVATTITADGLYLAPVNGLIQMRLRISAYTSGTITATGVATLAPATAV